MQPVLSQPSRHSASSSTNPSAFNAWGSRAPSSPIWPARRSRHPRQPFDNAVDSELDAPAFVTLEGQPIEVQDFADYMTDLRRVRVNAEFNANLCRGLLRVRYDGEPPTQGAEAPGPA